MNRIIANGIDASEIAILVHLQIDTSGRHNRFLAVAIEDASQSEELRAFPLLSLVEIVYRV